MNNMFNAFLSISIYSSVIIAAVLLLRGAFAQKLSAGFFRLVWLCLAIRLVLPFDISLPKAPITVEIPQVLYIESAVPLNGELASKNAPPFSKSNAQQASEAQPSSGKAAFSISAIKAALPAIWIFGAIACISVDILCYFIFMLRLKKSRKREESSAFNGVGDGLQIYSCANITSPILCGYFRPAIYVPQKAYTAREAQSIASHELMHYKQADTWLLLLLAVAAALSWFNPLVHIMRRTAISDIEMTVDEKLLRGAKLAQRREYGEMLFAEIAVKSKEGLLLVQYNSGKSTKERFKAILCTAAKSRGRVLLCAILAICVGASLLVSCAPKQSTSEPQPKISMPQSDSEPQSQSQQQSIAAPQETPQGADMVLPLGTDYTRVSSIHTDEETPFGVDLPAPKGTFIYAAFNGEIIEAVKNDEKWGNYIKIKHGDSLITTYAQCDELKVEKGDTVKLGEVIATVGSTGRSTGNHLHFGISVDDIEPFAMAIQEMTNEDIEAILEEKIYKKELGTQELQEWFVLLESVKAKFRLTQ